MSFCEVAVDFPKNGLLTYKIDAELFKAGKLVEVPLGRRKAKGCLIKLADESELKFDPKKIKSIQASDVLDLELPADYLELMDWMAKYYHYPLGKLISDCMPNVLKRPRKLKTIIGEGKELEFEADNYKMKMINEVLSSDGFADYFVHGVTGSGKSFIYIRIIQEILKTGKSALFLIPEINLSPQFLKFFKKYIDAEVFTYNSSISGSQKFGLFKHCLEAEKPCVIIGVRSSVFLPIRNLGVIIVDEFHDNSFKQEDRCGYSAKDVALKLGRIKQIPVVMGSATPNLETYNHYKKIRESNFFELQERFGSTVLPEIEIVSAEKEEDNEYWPFYQATLAKMAETINNGKKVIVYANKLGFSSYVECRSCQHIFQCPNCTVSLKYYKNKNTLSCHYCGYTQKKDEYCPSCTSLTFNHRGYGTEKIVEILGNYFKEALIKRFDRDVLKTNKDLEEILKEMESGSIDILVGTQMISKGHNFKDVETVVVLGADQALNIPDFRANEKLYQTLTQVSGRAGRFGDQGRVLIQTKYPNNKLFSYIQNNSFNEFYEDELEMRKEFDMPPYSKTAIMYISSKKNDQVQSFSIKSGQFLQKICRENFKDVEVLSPRPALIEKLVNKFTWCIFIKSTNIKNLHNLLKTFENNMEMPSGISLKLDIDPHNFY